MKDKQENRGAWVEAIIKDFINLSPENTLKNAGNEKGLGRPLGGLLAGRRPPLSVVQGARRTLSLDPPGSLSVVAFPKSEVIAGELTVISWILPHTEETKESLRKETVQPSDAWARARIFGEEVNVKLRQHVVDTLRAAGVDAVAPMLFPQWKMTIRNASALPPRGLSAMRRMRRASGTFSLCDGLITPVGKAMRTGSVVARLQIPPTPRPYTDHRAYCLFFTQGSCGKCIDRCPAGAVSKSGHDKAKCMAYLQVTRTFVTSHYGFEGYGCGFCQSGVPCESRIPVSTDAPVGQ